MVPGMTERERRADELCRLEWLADARLGPNRIGGIPRGRGSPDPRSVAVLPIGLWRRGLASARIYGQRLRLLPEAGGAVSESEAVPAR